MGFARRALNPTYGAVLPMIAPPFEFDHERIPARATGVIVIDLNQIRANWRALADMVAPAECAAVVKADAYGLGAAHIIPALVSEGCRTFFVATADEADQARRLAPQAVIYVLDGSLDSAFLASIDARPVLSDEWELGTWSTRCQVSGQRLPAALQIETGLNRRGMAPERLDGALTNVEFTLVMSHLACADDPAHPMNRQQLDAFNTARALLPPAPASLAASDGLMLGKVYHFEMVRPGYALYGGQAVGAARAPVEPVVRAYARILQISDVQPGQVVGYSATWTARMPSRIATIAAGYADGVFRHASGSDGRPGGVVAMSGKLCPIVGRVSMDLVTVDVSGCADAVACWDSPNGWVELIGPNITIEQVGARAGSIGYEVLTRLGRRFHRIYLGERA